MRIPPLLQSSSINRPIVDVFPFSKQKALAWRNALLRVVVLTCVSTCCSVLRKKNHNRKCSLGFFQTNSLAKKNPKENGFSVMSESGMRHNFMENTHLTLSFYDFLEHTDISARWDVREFHSFCFSNSTFLTFIT